MEQDENPDADSGRRPRSHLRLRADGPCAGAPGDDAGGGVAASTNPQRVVPAKAGTHTPRPIVLSDVADTFCSLHSRWLWVPAFAGTTLQEGSLSHRVKLKASAMPKRWYGGPIRTTIRPNRMRFLIEDGRIACP